MATRIIKSIFLFFAVCLAIEVLAWTWWGWPSYHKFTQSVFEPLRVNPFRSWDDFGWWMEQWLWHALIFLGVMVTIHESRKS